MISEKEVRHIAKLARLELAEAETAKMQKDLSAILDYFNLLKKAPKSGVVGGRSAHNLAFRKDEAVPQKREITEKLVAAAPDKKDDYIKVKTIL